jgi:hypothetical protein
MLRKVGLRETDVSGFLEQSYQCLVFTERSLLIQVVLSPDWYINSSVICLTSYSDWIWGEILIPKSLAGTKFSW